MSVVAISRYPLKSGAAEDLSTANFSFKGIEFDRHWMVVDEKGKFITQRTKGAQKLSLVRVYFEEGQVTFSAPTMNPLEINHPLSSEATTSVEIHKKNHLGVDCGDVAAYWISNYLGQPEGKLRLVQFPLDYRRSVSPSFTANSDAVVEFADGYPVLVANTASLNTLNERLKAQGLPPVPMSVFRPNLVVSFSEPWEEDRVLRIRVGEVELDLVKPCSRCPVTGVDQQSGSFTANPNQPRAALKEIHSGRHISELFPALDSEELDAAMFAMNAIVVKPGTIDLGDKVEVLSRR